MDQSSDTMKSLLKEMESCSVRKTIFANLNYIRFSVLHIYTLNRERK